MTTAEIELLIPQWGAPATRPVLADPWELPCGQFRQQAATNACLSDLPDFGWVLAERLSASGRNCTLLNRPAYRWILAAVQMLNGGPRASRRLKDPEIVSQAREIHASEMRPVINAALMTPAATARSVAKALNLDTTVVEAYESLFFNILERKNDIAYVRKLLGAGESSPLMVSRHTTPSDEEVLLSIGFKGTLEDVLRQVGGTGGAGDESVEELSERLLHNLLAAGADWTASPGSRRLAPPALVTHAIDFVKKSKVEKPDEVQPQAGLGIGSLLRDQLEKDAATIRRGVEQDVSAGLPN